MKKEKDSDKDVFFCVREKQSKIEFLDMAINILGYKDRAEWYRDMKKNTITEARLLAAEVTNVAKKEK